MRTNDATLIYQKAAYMVTLSDEQLAAGDVTGDGYVRTNDATEIYRKAAYINSAFDDFK